MEYEYFKHLWYNFLIFENFTQKLCSVQSRTGSYRIGLTFEKPKRLESVNQWMESYTVETRIIPDNNHFESQQNKPSECYSAIVAGITSMLTGINTIPWNKVNCRLFNTVYGFGELLLGTCSPFGRVSCIVTFPFGQSGKYFLRTWLSSESIAKN